MALRTPPRLIDFHSHFYDAAWYPSASPRGPANLLRAWPLLTNIQAQLEDMHEAGIDAKVLTAPGSTLLAPGEPLPINLMQRINDHFAELVATYPEHLLALATIDVFHGEAAAREMERAVQTLGIRGICIDCARGDSYLDVPEARPALETAAALDIPIFVHPVSPVGLTERLARLGHTGVLLARGTETAASVLALLRSGTLDQLPNLKIVIPMIGAHALLYAGIANQDYSSDGWRGESPAELRKRLYVDTMGYDPASIRFAVDLLGAEHVVNGSDWPIMPIIASRRLVEDTLQFVGLTDDQQTAIMSGNVLRLLTTSAPIRPTNAA